MKNLGKKLVLTALLVPFLALSALAQKNIDTDYSTETIVENYQVIYSPAASSWASGGMAEDRIVLTKRVSTGSGNYSEYYDSNDDIAFSFGTGFEFLYDEKLIAQDVYALKYYSIYYDKDTKKFDRKDVVVDSLNKVFPDAKIVKISEFEDGVLRVRKVPFKPLKILLVNDTPEYFYKYRFEGKNFDKYNLPGLLEIYKNGTIEFYHPNEDFRSLYIKVRPY